MFDLGVVRKDNRQPLLPLDSGDGIIRSRVLPEWREEAQARKAAEAEIERLRTLLERRDGH